MKNKKFFIVLVALVLSLGFNVYLMSKSSNPKWNDVSYKIMHTVILAEKEDNTLIKQALEGFARDRDKGSFSEEGNYITRQHEKKLLEFHKNQDYKGAKDYVLKENISIGYSDDDIK